MGITSGPDISLFKGFKSNLGNIDQENIKILVENEYREPIIFSIS